MPNPIRETRILKLVFRTIPVLSLGLWGLPTTVLDEWSFPIL